MNKKPYYSLDTYIKQTYGRKLYKIAIDAGLTCPNRDGTLDTKGCIFCSQGGSGDFAVKLSDTSDFEACLSEGIKRLSSKYAGSGFIAYFQAFTGTYGPISYLESIYEAALKNDRIAGISIATRPDCLPDEVLNLLKKLRERYPHKFIWIELGLQTIREDTAHFIRRGYSLSCFEEAVATLDALSIPIVVHLILGLPGESNEDVLKAVSYLNSLPIQGVKLQLLHILEGTDLAALYREHFEEICIFPTKEKYLDLLITCIEHLRPNIVIHRVTGDAPKALLLAPLWSSNKRDVLNSLYKEMIERSAFQGRLYMGKEGLSCRNP